MPINIEYVSPDKLNPSPYNPRRIDEESLRRLAKLLDSHGFVDPVIARRGDDLLIAGHQERIAAETRREGNLRALGTVVSPSPALPIPSIETPPGSTNAPTGGLRGA